MASSASPPPSSASDNAIRDVTEVPPPGRKTVLLFWAPWNDASKAGGPMDQVLRALSESTPPGAVRWGRVEAESHPAVTRHCGVSAVPTFVLLDASGSVVESLTGDNVAAQLTQAVQKLLAQPDPSPGAATVPVPAAAADASNPEDALRRRLEGLIRSSDVMLFMKGTPDAPRCGFSRQMVELLADAGIAFGSFDILQDEEVRQGLKKHSDWPTYPQLYVNGQLVGGLDVVRELADEEGSLREQLGLDADNGVGTNAASSASSSPPPALSLEERLKALVRQEPVMLFMKGLPSAPRCGFSRQLAEILHEEGVPYGSFDILQDEEVRQGLKTYSNWPTYPQLYVNGNLIGGLDIVKELRDDGSLSDVLREKAA